MSTSDKSQLLSLHGGVKRVFISSHLSALSPPPRHRSHSQLGVASSLAERKRSRSHSESALSDTHNTGIAQPEFSHNKDVGKDAGEDDDGSDNEEDDARDDAEPI